MKETAIAPWADAVRPLPPLAWANQTSEPGDAMKLAQLLVITSVVVLATACADDSSSDDDITRSTRPTPTVADAAPTQERYDPEPYCDSTRRLEKAGEKAFGSLGHNATHAEYEAAERRFVLDNADLLDALVAAAPPHLTDDVTTLLAAMRQRGGLEARAVTQREATRAEHKILTFERQNC